jgi:quercetin dioxygenase-like cupin family protein
MSTWKNRETGAAGRTFTSARSWIGGLALVGLAAFATTTTTTITTTWAGDATQVAAAPVPAAQSTTLLVSSLSGDGKPLTYPTGKPLITARITELPPGGVIPRHRHPIPLCVYMLEGELTVYDDAGNARQFKAGDAFMESTGWHYGSNDGTTRVRLYAVYMGEEGAPLSVRETSLTH